MWSFIWALLAIITLTAPAQGQSSGDEFYSNSNPGSSQSGIVGGRQCGVQERKAVEVQELQAQNEWEKARIYCGRDANCARPAAEIFDRRMKQLSAELSDINTNCLIQQEEQRPERGCGDKERKAQQEDKFRAQNEWDKARIYCGRDANCARPAAEIFDRRMKQLSAEWSDINTNCLVQEGSTPQVASNPPPGAPNGSSPTATSPGNVHPSGGSPAAQNNARGVSSLPTEVDPFGRIEASVPPEEEPGGTGLGSASGTSPNNGSNSGSPSLGGPPSVSGGGSNPGVLTGNAAHNEVFREPSGWPSTPPGAAPSNSVGGNNPGALTGGVSENTPAIADSHTTPIAGIPPLIAETPKFAPTPGAAATAKVLTGSVSKTVSASPSAGNPPRVAHALPPTVNGQSSNRSALRRTGAASNPPATGASGAQPGPQPQAASRNPFAGALRGVRLFADWIAGRWPGGPSGLKAASEASNELKRPYEEQWTKPHGGIQQVADTVAMHGAGKVAKTVLRAGATKFAQSPAGRKLLQQLAAAAAALGAGGKKLAGSIESASAETASAESGALGKYVPPRPTVKPTLQYEPDFNRYKAFWGKDPKAFAMFSKNGNGAVVTDLYRGSQPEGSGGVMLADALRSANLSRPGFIRFGNIIEKNTIAQMKTGVPLPDTKLGHTMANTVGELGGRIVNWQQGISAKGQLWMTGTIQY